MISLTVLQLCDSKQWLHVITLVWVCTNVVCLQCFRTACGGNDKLKTIKSCSSQQTRECRHKESPVSCNICRMRTCEARAMCCLQGMMSAAVGPPSTSQSSHRPPFHAQRSQAPPLRAPQDNLESAISLAGGSDNAIALTGGPPQAAIKKNAVLRTGPAADIAAAAAVSAAEEQIAQAKASQGAISDQTAASSGNHTLIGGKPPTSRLSSSSSDPAPSGAGASGPSPPNPGMGQGPAPPLSRAAPNGPGFIRPPSGMRPIEGPPENMNGNLNMSMGMSGPMGFPPFRPGFPPMGPYPMMPMGPYPMMHGMPNPMMMGHGPMRGGPMGPPPMGQFMPDFGHDGFRHFGERYTVCLLRTHVSCD